MKTSSLLAKIYLLGMVAGVIAASVAILVPAPAWAETPASGSANNSGKTGLCHDAFSGQTYTCGDPGGVKVDGKAGGAFDKSKCYAFTNPDAGWVVADCTAAAFQLTPTIVQPIRKPQGDAGKCLDVSKSGSCNLDCPTNLANSGGCDFVARYINPAINVAAGIIGVLLVGSYASAGIMYSGARDNPQVIDAAKKRIANTTIGFLGYIFMYWFLQWIVPGGFL